MVVVCFSGKKKATEGFSFFEGKRTENRERAKLLYAVCNKPYKTLFKLHLHALIYACFVYWASL